MRLSLGYRPAALRPAFTGTLTGLEPSFPSSGPTTLGVSALGHLERLRKGTKQRGFSKDIPDSVIATIVAAENQLISIPDAAATVVSVLGAERPRFQHEQSDEMFLRSIAAEYGFDMWVDGDFLNFKLPVPLLPPAAVELRWGESLIDITPRVTSVGQVAAVSIARLGRGTQDFRSRSRRCGRRPHQRAGAAGAVRRTGQPVEGSLSA